MWGRYVEEAGVVVCEYLCGVAGERELAYQLLAVAHELPCELQAHAHRIAELAYHIAKEAEEDGCDGCDVRMELMCAIYEFVFAIEALMDNRFMSNTIKHLEDVTENLRNDQEYT